MPESKQKAFKRKIINKELQRQAATEVSRIAFVYIILSYLYNLCIKVVTSEIVLFGRLTKAKK